MNRDPFEMSDEEANEFWEDLAEMYEDEPSHLDLSKGVGIETEPIVGWRVWRVQTRANETYESQTMGSLATLIKLAVENPIEEVLAQVAADVTLQPWGYSSGGAWPGYEAKEAQHHGAHEAQYVSTGFEHQPPVWECGCGIWAFDTLERLRERFDTQGTEFCVGTVALWGKVIRTTAGFRAQFAYPQELEYICLRNPTDIDRGVATAISRAYGVPCVAMSPWRSPDFPSGLRGVHASSAYASITRRVPTNWRQDVLRDLQKERKVDWAKAQEEFQRHWVPYLPKPRYVPTRPGLWQRIRGFVQYWK